MDPIASAILGIAMRWTHVLSVVMVLGGLLYARLAVAPALASLPAEAGAQFAAAVNSRFRPWLRFAIFTLVVSGLYNLVTKSNIPPGYHMWFGIKMLFAMHVIVVSFLLSRAAVTQEKRNRMITGVVIVGVLIVMLSGYLRLLSNWMQS